MKGTESGGEGLWETEDQGGASKAAWSLPAHLRADVMKFSCSGLFQAGIRGLVKMASDQEGRSY